MAKVLNAFTKPFRWLKWAWARDPVIFMSCVFGISGPVFVFFSPWTEDTVKTMKSIPHVYPSAITLITESHFVLLRYTAIILNIVTILALRKTSSLPKPLKTLLLSLAVSDLGVGLLVQPLYIALRVMNIEQNTAENHNANMYNTLRVFHVTGTIFSYASFFGVTAISADRFLAIHLHLRYQELVTHKRVVAVVISIWVFSAVVSLLVFHIQKITFIVLGIIAVVCFISTTFFYVKIYLAVRRHRNQMQAPVQALQVQQIAHNGEMANFARLNKSALGTFYVYLLFLACYLPDFCIIVVDVINSGQRSALIKKLSLYTLTLVFLNSSLNPLIYCWKLRDNRRTIMVILRNMFQCHN